MSVLRPSPSCAGWSRRPLRSPSSAVAPPIGTIAAERRPGLPPRSAAQLLVDLQNARLDGLVRHGRGARRPRPAVDRRARRLVPRQRPDPLVTGTHTAARLVLRRRTGSGSRWWARWARRT